MSGILRTFEPHELYNPSLVPVFPYCSIKAVILDLDDVVVHNRTPEGEGFYDIARTAVVRELGDELKNETLKHFTDVDGKRAYELCGTASTRTMMAYILHEAKILKGFREPENETHPLVDRLVRDRNKLHLKVLKDVAMMSPGAEAVMRFACDHTEYGLAAASNGSIEEGEIIYERFLKPYMDWDQVVMRDHVQHPKPYDDVYERAYLRTGAPDTKEDRAAAIGVDDSKAGVKSMANAGVFGIGLAVNFDASEFSDTPAKAVFASMTEVHRFLMTTIARAA